MDGIQNGAETGPDCGGACARACLFEADSVSVLWTRSFLVVPGRYNAVAYLENQNKNLAVQKIKYSFRFADNNNLYLGRREGIASIPPGRAFAIFERGIELANSTPVYTTFEFTEIPNWVTVSEAKIEQLKVSTWSIALEGEDSYPHMSAVLKNNSLFTIPNMSVVAILYDENGNAVSASSTYLDSFGPEEEQAIDFTWPMPFDRPIISKEILPSFNIFEVILR